MSNRERAGNGRQIPHLKKSSTRDAMDNRLVEEARAFDRQAVERVSHGLMPDMQRLRKVPYFYNNSWREPEFVWLTEKPRMDFVLDVVKRRKGQVAELGCGMGVLSLEMARLGCVVLGVDLSPKSIAIAREVFRRATKGSRFGSLRYEVADFETMDLGQEQYDSVVFFSSLHHIAHPERTLRRVYRALKPGGNLVISEPVRENFTRHSALVAGLLRLASPTWRPYPAKLKGLDSEKAIMRYVQEIFDEYTYKHEHQSPNDNATASEEVMVSAIGKFFAIKEVVHSDAFIDKLIGGLRGPHRFVLARALKAADDYAITSNLLPATSVRIWAVKE